MSKVPEYSPLRNVQILFACFDLVESVSLYSTYLILQILNYYRLFISYCFREVKNIILIVTLK